MATQSKQQLNRFTAIFASGTMLSRLLGMVRDMVWLVIPAESRAPFIVAFRLPNMLRDLVGEGAMNAAFVPVFSELETARTRQELRDAVAAVMSVMIVILALLTVLGVVLAPALLRGTGALHVLTGGQERSGEELLLAGTLARWTFPYLFFIGMSVFAMGALFSVRHYSTPSWSPALLNVAFIAVCLGFRDRFAEPAHALVVGVWLGGVAQLFVLYVAMGREIGVWRPSFRFGHPAVRTVLFLMGPVMLGQAAGEVNKLVDTLFAYSRGDDAVNALYYANRLVQLPFSVFGLATAAAVLPAASAAAARKDTAGLRKTIMQGLIQSSFLIVPATLGLIALGEPTIRLLFGRFKGFTPDDSHRTAVALVMYAIGLPAFAWVKVTVSGFYAAKDTKTPVIISSCSMLLNIVLNCLFVRPFGYAGLAAATSISFAVNFALLYSVLSRRVGRLWDAAFVTSLVRIAASAIIMAAVAYAAFVRVFHLFADDTLLANLAYVFVPMALAVAAYAAACYALGVRELSGFLSLLRRRAKR